jgi:transcriptional regulator NrdR family protein
MWCAACRGTYLAVRRLLPDLHVIDPRRSRPESSFDAEKLRLSLAEPLRKPAGEGLRDPSTLELLPPLLQPLAAELVFDFVAEQVSRAAAEPNGKVTTDEIAAIAMAALFNTHELAFLRSAVHHRMLSLEATEEEWEELAEIAGQFGADAHEHTLGPEPAWPALREPAPAVLCPRCGSPRVARRSRASVVRGLDQQAASCSHCGQRFIWEWGSRVPLLITSRRGESLFDPQRFRAGIRHSVRKLPGPASIWSDERLVGSAASSALASATPYIRTPRPGQPLPSIDSSDLWLAAASALRGIHPLAYVRYTLHSGGVGALDWRAPDYSRRLSRMLDIVQGIGRRYFKASSFPALAPRL